VVLVLTAISHPPAITVPISASVDGVTGSASVTALAPTPVEAIGACAHTDDRLAPTAGLAQRHDKGRRRGGQFGDGTFTSSLVPKAAAPGMKLAEVVVGRMYTCGCAEDGQLYCWGDNEAGHVGNGSWNTTGVAVPAADDAYCWGGNGSASWVPTSRRQ